MQYYQLLKRLWRQAPQALSPVFSAGEQAGLDIYASLPQAQAVLARLEADFCARFDVSFWPVCLNTYHKVTPFANWHCRWAGGYPRPYRIITLQVVPESATLPNVESPVDFVETAARDLLFRSV